MINIINHSVKINDIGLLQFLYPDFIIIDKLPIFTSRPIIFIGETKYISKIKELGVNYIIVSSLGEFDLNDRLTLLDITFSKYNKKIPKYLLEFYKDLDDTTFIECFKQHWITGKWNIKEFDSHGIFLDFLCSFRTDTFKMMRTYLELIDKVGAEYIEMSLLTFLTKVVHTPKNASKWYLKIINEYKHSKYELIEPAIEKYMNTKVYNTELRLFNFIMNLNRRT